MDQQSIASDLQPLLQAESLLARVEPSKTVETWNRTNKLVPQNHDLLLSTEVGSAVAAGLLGTFAAMLWVCNIMPHSASHGDLDNAVLVFSALSVGFGVLAAVVFGIDRQSYELQHKETPASLNPLAHVKLQESPEELCLQICAANNTQDVLRTHTFDWSQEVEAYDMLIVWEEELKDLHQYAGEQALHALDDAEQRQLEQRQVSQRLRDKINQTNQEIRTSL